MEAKSLKTALSFLHSERNRAKKRQLVIDAFDKLPLNERQSLFNKYKGCKHHICFIRDFDKLYIMGYFK